MSSKNSLIDMVICGGTSAGIGAFAQYMYVYVTKSMPFTWWRFAANIVLGFFVGQVIGSFLPPDFQYRDGILLMAGFSVYQFLQIAEAKMAVFFRGLLGKATAEKKED